MLRHFTSKMGGFALIAAIVGCSMAGRNAEAPNATETTNDQPIAGAVATHFQVESAPRVIKGDSPEELCADASTQHPGDIPVDGEILVSGAYASTAGQVAAWREAVELREGSIISSRWRQKAPSSALTICYFDAAFQDGRLPPNAQPTRMVVAVDQGHLVTISWGPKERLPIENPNQSAE